MKQGAWSEASLPKAGSFLCRIVCAFVLVMSVSPALAAADNAPPIPSLSQEVGLPPIHNFDPNEYAASPQNWAVVQGSDGVIYVGNTDGGVLTFDGARWGRIAVPGRMVVRSLAVADDGRIYVGLVGDFGYLKRAADGVKHYVSLLDKVPQAQREFADVWRVYVTDQGVYFSTLTAMFRLHAGKISVIKPETRFHVAFQVHGKVYIREVGRGLMQVVGDKLQLVPGTGFFADKRIYALLSWDRAGVDQGGMLIGTREHGWFRLEHGQLRPWHVDEQKALDKAQIYDALWLADGRLAVATLRGGLYLLNRKGQLLTHLDRDNGLMSNSILDLFLDRRHGLWLATGSDISRVDVASPLTLLGYYSGLRGGIMDLARRGKTMYAATTEGLYRLVHQHAGGAHFVPVPGVQDQTWAAAPFDDQLIVAGNEGVYAVAADDSVRELPVPIKTDPTTADSRGSAQALLRSKAHPQRMFVGYNEGLGSLCWDGQHWVNEGLVKGAHRPPRSMVEVGKNQLWLGLWNGGVTLLTLPDGWTGPHDPRPVHLQFLDTKAGLPEGGVTVVKIHDEVRFLTFAGIYLFDPQTGRFSPDPAFAHLFPDGTRGVAAVHDDGHGNLWMFTTDEHGLKQTGYARRVDGRWQWQVTPMQPLAGIGTYVIGSDPDGVVWMGGSKGLYRYDPSRWHPNEVPFKTLMRRVITTDGQLLPLTGNLTLASSGSPEPRSIYFQYAAPSYVQLGATRYRVWLEGLYPSWSYLTDKTSQSYPNLPPGNYRFHVKSRNVYGEMGKTVVYAFRILPPWYLSVWGWALWIFCGVLVAVALVYLTTWVWQRRNRRLAELVDARTAELAQANGALQESNEALAEQIVTDPLTGLRNRRYLAEHIEHDVAMSRRSFENRHKHPQLPETRAHLLFLMVDIDHFKRTNDTYGHAAGDQVLRQFADILRVVVRDMDMAVRWGGEEFLIVARFVAGADGPQFAERIRAAVAGYQFDLGEGESIQHTCSIGFACYPAFMDRPDRLNWEQVVNLADRCLYAAKQHGRNAWVGAMGTSRMPDIDPASALDASIACLPAAGTLDVRASWVLAAIGGPDKDKGSPVDA